MWRKHDRALCVNDTPRLGDGALPIKRGVVYLVDDVMSPGEDGIPGLVIDGIEQANGDYLPAWGANRFRRIIPACDRASFSVEVTKEL